MNGAARQAPPGFTWRLSFLSHLPRVLVLERADAHQVGSVGPGKRGKWLNRDTGQEFDSCELAQADVEKFI